MNASATTTLFIGDLSVICDEFKLYDLFSRFGILESVQLKKSDRDPQRAHLGFGFIKFASHDSAEQARQEMNGYFFLGRTMIVDWAVDYGKKQSPSSVRTASENRKKPTAQIHVMFVTRELNRRVSELDLGAVFSRYGNLVDISIKKNVMNHEYGIQSGYAFIHFALTSEGLKSALTAVEEVNNLVIDNIAYQCKLTYTLRAQFMSMNYFEEESGGSLPSSVTFVDSTIKSYECTSLTHRVKPPSGNSFYSFNMDLPRMMGRTKHSLSPLHRLFHPLETETNTLSPSLKKTSDDCILNIFPKQPSITDVISPNFPVNKNHRSSNPFQYLHPSHDDDSHHQQLIADPLSSFVSNEDSLRKRNNNMMTHFYQYNNNANNYVDYDDDVLRFEKTKQIFK